jgi:DNA-binding IclR family transcriptional regulator
MPDYTSPSQQRLLSVQRLLAQHSVSGLSISQIAEALQATSPSITRDLANLEQQGFAERLPNNSERWRPGQTQLSLWRDFSAGLQASLKQILNQGIASLNSGQSLD